MDNSIFKFLLKKGLALPRNTEELNYVKKIHFTERDLKTPSFEETWEFITSNKKLKKAKTTPIRSDVKGMSMAARFGENVTEEVRKQMELDKAEAKKDIKKDDETGERD